MCIRDRFTRYMYYERALAEIKSSTTEALRKFYEGDGSYPLLHQPKTDVYKRQYLKGSMTKDEIAKGLSNSMLMRQLTFDLKKLLDCLTNYYQYVDKAIDMATFKEAIRSEEHTSELQSQR